MNKSSLTPRDSEDTLVEPPEKNAQDANADAVAGGLIGGAMGAAYLGNFPGTSPAIGIAGMTGGLQTPPLAEQEQPHDPDAYWRENHPSQPFAIGKPYETYESAYRAGYSAYLHHQGESFGEAEASIRAEYEKSELHLPWEQARPAALAAWEHAHHQNHREDYLS